MMFDHVSKETFAAAYNQQYNMSNIRKFLFRRGNHWALKLERLQALIQKLDLPGHHLLDLGCSIGTHAVEFAGQGWEAEGVDLDASAIETAQRLASHLKLNIPYKVGDISVASLYPPETFDVVLAGDIVEHLPDHVLDQSLRNVKEWLRPGGYVIIHTVPTFFDYIFHKSLLWILVAPLAFLDDRPFTRLVRVYDRWVRRIPGLVREDPVSKIVHCNLQEPAGLKRHVEQAGFEVIALQTEILEERFKSNRLKQILFKNKTVFQKNVFCVGWKSFL